MKSCHARLQSFARAESNFQTDKRQQVSKIGSEAFQTRSRNDGEFNFPPLARTRLFVKWAHEKTDTKVAYGGKTRGTL